MVKNQDVEQRLLNHLGNSKNVAQRLRGQDE